MCVTVGGPYIKFLAQKFVHLPKMHKELLTDDKIIFILIEKMIGGIKMWSTETGLEARGEEGVDMFERYLNANRILGMKKG